MVRLKAIARTIPVLMLSSTFPAVLHAQSTGLEDMVGARAGQAETELDRRGYSNVGGQQGDDRTYTYWWNPDRRQCVSIATMNGRYNSVQPTTAPDCGMPAHLQPNPAYQGQAATPPPMGRPVDPSFGQEPERPVVDGRNVDLGLVCFGDGSRTGIATGTTWTWNRDSDRYEYGNYTTNRREDFDASVTVQTWPGGGRIRLPRSLIPPLNSRGDNGWWDLTDVSMNADTIHATYRLNGLNKPRLTIDRRSGRITIAGTADYGFRGECDEIGHETRRF